MFKDFQFELEIIPKINVLRDSDIFNLLAMTVFDGYLPKQQAIDFLAESLSDEVSPEFMPWAVDFIQTCFCSKMDVLEGNISWSARKNREMVAQVLKNNRHWDLGWVYVFTSKSMPGIVKVGHTKDTPEKRAKKLSHTGNPHSYEVRFALLVKNPKRIEVKVHTSLRVEGYHEGKEWFRCTVDEAVEVIVHPPENLFPWHHSYP